MAKGNTSGLKKIGLISLVILVGAVFLTAATVQQRTHQESQASALSKRANLFALPGEAVVGEDIVAVWVNSRLGEEDWIGLYLKGADNSAPLEKKLLKDCESVSKRSRQQVGMCTFTAPQVAGEVEFRMFSVIKRQMPQRPQRPARGTSPTVTPLPSPTDLVRQRHLGTSNPVKITAVAPTEEPTPADISPTP